MIYINSTVYKVHGITIKRETITSRKKIFLILKLFSVIVLLVVELFCYHHRTIIPSIFAFLTVASIKKAFKWFGFYNIRYGIRAFSIKHSGKGHQSIHIKPF